MITAQDIREKTFEKSRINGYDMASVDDFLEQLADELAAAQRDNAVLKQKMKVLVDKIEEYRSNEEALNLAILSAQKLAVQIEKDARQRADEMLADAEAQVKAKVGSIEEETEIQKQRLADAKAATTKYFEAARALCNAQLRNLENINEEFFAEAEEEPAPAPAPEAEDVIPAVEETAAEPAPEAEEAPAGDPFDFDKTVLI
jgi:cell division initiation protein